MTVILIGFMGAGKTTVGQLLANQLAQPFFDTDQLITAQTGQTPGEIFATAGERAFRKIEHQILKATISKSGVIATGGGVVELTKNLTLLSRLDLPIIYLSGSFGQTVERLIQDKTRPIVRNKSLSALADLWQQRLTRYATLATKTINTDNKNAVEVAVEISTYLKVVQNETIKNR